MLLAALVASSAAFAPSVRLPSCRHEPSAMVAINAYPTADVKLKERRLSFSVAMGATLQAELLDAAPPDARARTATAQPKDMQEKWRMLLSDRQWSVAPLYRSAIAAPRNVAVVSCMVSVLVANFVLVNGLRAGTVLADAWRAFFPVLRTLVVASLMLSILAFNAVISTLDHWCGGSIASTAGSLKMKIWRALNAPSLA